MRIVWLFSITLLLAFAAAMPLLEKEVHSSVQYQCAPTPEDEMGPFYRPQAPLRSVIGAGYILTGTVKSAADCSAIAAPLIELWQAAPNGRYDDNHRAAIITDESGEYRFETNFPGEYYTRPPHIHIRVSAKGFQTLVTQHYLQKGTRGAVFDLVLIPDPP
jgi:protocatechuate 3,4-dioxygenase beta subunit